jgi:hypothetical protein
MARTVYLDTGLMLLHLLGCAGAGQPGQVGHADVLLNLLPSLLYLAQFITCLDIFHQRILIPIDISNKLRNFKKEISRDLEIFFVYHNLCR